MASSKSNGSGCMKLTCSLFAMENHKTVWLMAAQYHHSISSHGSHQRQDCVSCSAASLLTFSLVLIPTSQILYNGPISFPESDLTISSGIILSSTSATAMCKIVRYKLCISNSGQVPPEDELIRCSEWSQLALDARTGDATARRQYLSHIQCKLLNPLVH